MTGRDRRATAAKFSAAAAADETPPRPTQSPTARTKRVRRTVDMAPARHHALTRWCEETAIELGEARISGQDVINALVARLLTDETLARKIHADLQRGLEP